MNQAECRSFFKSVVFVHFPSINSWLMENSVDPVATVEAWALTLENISVNEATSVILRWTSDRLPRPDARQMQDIALNIKSVVDRDRHESRKHLIVKEIRDTTPLVKRMPIKMARYYQAISRNATRYRNNEISLEECQALNAEILRRADIGQSLEGYEQDALASTGASDDR